MLIWGAIYLLGLAAPFVGLIHLIRGIRKREKKRMILAFVLPVVLWVGIYALHEADRRFIEEETRKNGGKLPDYVW